MHNESIFYVSLSQLFLCICKVYDCKIRVLSIKIQKWEGNKWVWWALYVSRPDPGISVYWKWSSIYLRVRPTIKMRLGRDAVCRPQVRRQ